MATARSPAARHVGRWNDPVAADRERMVPNSFEGSARQAARAELAGRALAGGLSRREAVAEVRRAAGGPTARAEGEGAAGGRKPTSRVSRTPPAETKVTVEDERGPDDPTARAAVEEGARRRRDEMGAADPAAARSGSPAGRRPG